MSVTVRAIGPNDPWSEGDRAYTPPRLPGPAVGRIPTMQVQAAGRRMDARPSCPTPTVAKLAATQAAVPPEEPPTVRSRAYGFRVEPKSEPWVSPPPNSPSVVFPTIIAPARFNLSTTKLSRSG